MKAGCRAEDGLEPRTRNDDSAYRSQVVVPDAEEGHKGHVE